MLIKLDVLTEFFLWVLLFGVTFSNATVEVCITFIIILFLVKMIMGRRAEPPETPLNYVIMALFLIIAISFSRSEYYSEGFRGLIRIVKYSLFYFAVIDLFRGDKKRIVRIFWVIVFISGFTFLNGIFQDIFGFDILRHRTVNRIDFLHRIRASFVHSNDFGAYIISLLPITFTFFLSAISKRKRIILAFVSLLGLYCLVRTSSRGAWIGFIVGIAVYIFYANRYVFKKSIINLVPALIILFIMVSPNGLLRIKSLFDVRTSTVWERLQLWKGTWLMVREHPVLGFGINTFSRYFPRYKPSDYPDLSYTHNSYLQMWSEIGIVGLVAFLILIFTVLCVSFKNLKGKLKTGFKGLLLLGFLSGYIAFLIQAGVDTNLYSLALVTNFWFMNAYLIALNGEINQGLGIAPGVKEEG